MFLQADQTGFTDEPNVGCVRKTGAKNDSQSGVYVTGRMGLGEARVCRAAKREAGLAGVNTAAPIRPLRGAAWEGTGHPTEVQRGGLAGDLNTGVGGQF